MTALQIIKNYDDAFRILQDVIIRQDSLVGMNFLTRVEFYLLNQSRRQMTLLGSDISQPADSSQVGEFGLCVGAELGVP
jgi:hypothetical protein